jgi:dipeptidase E
MTKAVLKKAVDPIFEQIRKTDENGNEYWSAREFAKALEELGLIIDELEISTADVKIIKEKLTTADYIYVEGGNTFFLLQELKRTGTDKLIIEQIKKGKLYIGCSAGAIIASKNIEYVGLMDSPELAPDLNGDYSALGIVDFCIVPHYTNFPGEKIETLICDCLNLQRDSTLENRNFLKPEFFVIQFLPIGNFDNKINQFLQDFIESFPFQKAPRIEINPVFLELVEFRVR